MCKKRYNTAIMKLQAQKRATEEKASVIRKAGMIPAVCYGPDQEAVTVAIDSREFIKTYREAGNSTIIDLEADGESYEVLVKDIDYHPVTDEILHIDFYAIKRGEEMQLSVSLVFVGESQADKDGGILNEILHELEVRCLPRNIPSEIEVDLSTLTEAGMAITVGDLQLGEGVVATAESTDVVVSVSEASEEVEEETGDDQAALDAVLADPQGDSKEEE